MYGVRYECILITSIYVCMYVCVCMYISTSCMYMPLYVCMYVCVYHGVLQSGGEVLYGLLFLPQFTLGNGSENVQKVLLLLVDGLHRDVDGDLVHLHIHRSISLHVCMYVYIFVNFQPTCVYVCMQFNVYP